MNHLRWFVSHKAICSISWLDGISMMMTIQNRKLAFLAISFIGKYIEKWNYKNERIQKTNFSLQWTFGQTVSLPSPLTNHQLLFRPCLTYWIGSTVSILKLTFTAITFGIRNSSNLQVQILESRIFSADFELLTTKWWLVVTDKFQYNECFLVSFCPLKCEF